MSKRTWLLILGGVLFLLFFILAFCNERFWVTLNYPKVDKVAYGIMELTEPFRQLLRFSLVCALLPGFTVLLWVFGPVSSGSRRALSALLIVVCMLASGVLRYFYFVQQLRKLAAAETGDFFAPQQTYPGNGEIERYMLYGLCAGVALSWLLFRDKKKLV